MRLAQIDGGMVVNVIEVDPSDIPDWAAGWPEAGDAGPGWAWDGQVFQAPPPPSPVVPASVSRLQARLALLDAGLLASAEMAVGQADVLTQMAWAEATEFRRDSPTIAALAQTLGLSPGQVDDLFRAAAGITL